MGCSRCEARSPSPLAARECGRRAWPRRDPASPLLRRALSPDRLHPRSAEAKCSISPLCCGVGVAVSGGGGASGGRRSAGWRAPAPAPPTPPPPEKPDEPPLPRIAEEKDSPTHHAGHSKLPTRTPAKQSTPSIFTSSPKSVDRGVADANASFASLSLSDESFIDTSMDTSNLDTSREVFLDDSRSSTEPNVNTSDLSKKISTTFETMPSTSQIELHSKTRQTPESISKEDDLKAKDKSKTKQEKSELKKQDSIKRIEISEVKVEEKIPEVKIEEKPKSEKPMERVGSMKKSEKADAKKEKQEKAELKKQEKIEAKKNESAKKLEGLKRQESVEINKSPESLECVSEQARGRNSMVSKLLGVMGRKTPRDRDEDDHRPAKKQDKHAKKKGQSNPPTPLTVVVLPPKATEATFPERANEKADIAEDKKTKKGRGRASSSSSGEK